MNWQLYWQQNRKRTDDLIFPTIVLIITFILDRLFNLTGHTTQSSALQYIMAPDPNSKSGRLRTVNGHVFSSSTAHVAVDLGTVGTEELIRQVKQRTAAGGKW